MFPFELPPYVKLRAQSVEHSPDLGPLLRLEFEDTRYGRVMTTYHLGETLPESDHPSLLRFLETWTED